MTAPGPKGPKPVPGGKSASDGVPTAFGTFEERGAPQRGSVRSDFHYLLVFRHDDLRSRLHSPQRLGERESLHLLAMHDCNLLNIAGDGFDKIGRASFREREYKS